jgi:MoxR-like ATPase
LHSIREAIGAVIVGQTELVDRLLVALLCNGHVLIEGVPGLAKTLTVRSFAAAMEASFKRIQFTPDLLPGDLTGTLIYDPHSHAFTPHKGPVFANIVLADEINRSPAKVQSALLEAMQERQITIGNETYPLPNPFLVLATQNPIEQEGTYPLPEAQLDRFIFKVHVDYPSREEERTVMRRMAHAEPTASVSAVVGLEAIPKLRAAADAVHVAEGIEDYILRLVDATRHPVNYSGLESLTDSIRHGASPRASIYLLMAARAWAFIQGRDYVIPDDVKAIATDVLRHRIALSYRAEAAGLHSDAVVETLLQTIAVPHAENTR